MDSCGNTAMLHLALPGSGHDGSRIVFLSIVCVCHRRNVYDDFTVVLVCTFMEMVMATPGLCLHVIYCGVLFLNLSMTWGRYFLNT